MIADGFWRRESQFPLRTLEDQLHSGRWNHVHGFYEQRKLDSVDYLRTEKEHKAGGSKRWGWFWEEGAGRVEGEYDQNTLCETVKDFIK